MNTEASQPVAPPPGRRPWQFHLRDLLIWTAVFAVFLASMKWITANYDPNRPIDDISVLSWEYVSLPELLGFGFLVVLIICLCASIWIDVRLYRRLGRPYTLFLFIGYVIFLFGWILPEMFETTLFPMPDYSLVRLLVAMVISSSISVVEVLVRCLGRASLVASLLAIGVSFGCCFWLAWVAVCVRY